MRTFVAKIADTRSEAELTSKSGDTATVRLLAEYFALSKGHQAACRLGGAPRFSLVLVRIIPQLAVRQLTRVGNLVFTDRTDLVG